jgi:hypothetical protein
LSFAPAAAAPISVQLRRIAPSSSDHLRLNPKLPRRRLSKISDLELGDPAFGKRKWLIVVCHCRGKVYFSTANHDQSVVIFATDG